MIHHIYPNMDISRWLQSLIKHISVELRIAYHAQVNPSMLSLRTHHPFYTWWWCEKGHARVRTKDGDYHIHPGQWVLLPTMRERRQDIDAGTCLVSISFQAVWATGVPLLNMRRPLIVDGVHDNLFRRTALAVCRLWQDMCKQTSSMKTDSPLQTTNIYRLQGRLHLFVSELFDRAITHGCQLNPPGSGDDRLDYVLEEMRRDVRAGPLPLAAWSRQAGLSRSQLDRLCREWLGMNLRQRRDQMLMEEIRQRLLIGSESIKELAASLGFVDSAHFCRWVRRNTGHSPLEIRQNLSA